MSENPRTSRPFILYVIAVGFVAAGVLAYSWSEYPPHWSWQLAFLAAAVLLSENYAFSIEPYSISLAFPLAMAGAVLSGPASGAIIAGLTFMSYREIRDRKSLAKIAFNLGQLVLSTAAAALVYARLGGRFLQGADGAFIGWGSNEFPQTLAAMVAAAAVCVVANMLLTATGMSLLARQPIRSAIGTMLSFMPTQLALAFVGYLIAETLSISPLALPLFIAPLLVARQLYVRYADMKTAFVDTVGSLVGALEAKDPYTRGHSERVADYVAALGGALEMNAREIERIEYAALLHDLGKLAVPTSVLVKPGRLEPEEMALIQEHPRGGSVMIGRIPPLKDLATVVAQHHEWYDGTGYPTGIAGDDISLGARLLCVADSFDAMTTTRAYRPALSHDQAIAELIGGAGTQFDPELVRVFIEARVGREELGPEALGTAELTAKTEPLGMGG